MTPEQYEQACSIFLEVSELPKAERLRRLSVSSEDSTILRHVTAMLDQDEDDRLDSGALANLTGLADLALDMAHDDIEMPEQIGAYRVIRELGRGGMGVVYEATQDSPSRQVALKVMRPGSGRALLRRFRQEAQVLAMMNHPTIAQVYEAGEATTNRGDTAHFIAMELVHGVPVTEFVTRAGASERERLELIVRIAEGVLAAHQCGIIHRDLKPSNILVVDDGSGIGAPKILDFGIAKAAGTNLELTTLATEAGQLVGTLAYMSPEQVSGDSAAVDTRADIHALGVIAYEVLTGRRPFVLDGKSLPDAVRVIQEDDPTSLSSIDRRLRGDVDTIVRKALEKDPERRYQSVGDIVSDITRYLKDQPIVARPPSAIYQLRKFTRRNKPLVGGIAATVIALVMGIIGTTWYAVEAAARDAESRRGMYRASMTAATSAKLAGQLDLMMTALNRAPEQHIGWEWHHMRSRLAAWAYELDMASTGAVCESDGILAAIDEAGALLRWDVRRREPLPSATLDVPLRTLASCGDQGTVLGVDTEHRVHLIDLETATIIKKPELVHSASFPPQVSQGGELIAVVDKRTLTVYSHRDERVVRTFEPDRGMNSTAISDSGRYCAATTAVNNRGIVLDLGTGEQLGMQSSEGPISVAFSEDDSLVAFGTANRNIHVYRLDPFEPLHVLEAHEDRVYQLQFLPSGDLVSLGGDDTLRRWDLTRGVQTDVALVPHRVGRNDGLTRVPGLGLVTGGERILVWDGLAEHGVLRGHSTYVYQVTWSPDSRLVATTQFKDAYTYVWDADTDRCIVKLPLDGISAPWGDLCFSRDGRSLFTMRSEGRWEEMHIYEWDTSSWDRVNADVGKDELHRRGMSRNARGSAWSPDGRLSAKKTRGANLNSNGVQIWRGDEILGTIKPTRGCVAWSIDGTLLAAPNDDSVTLWSARTLEPVRSLPHPGGAFAVDFSPDGTRLATGANDGIVRLWDTTTWDLVAELYGHESYVHDVRFSPDGTRLASASGDTTVRIWDTLSRAERLKNSTPLAQLNQNE